MSAFALIVIIFNFFPSFQKKPVNLSDALCPLHIVLDAGHLLC